MHQGALVRYRELALLLVKCAEMRLLTALQ
jgi:hypothetical protein